MKRLLLVIASLAALSVYSREFKIDFSEAFAEKATKTFALKIDDIEGGEEFEAYFETDLPADVHWFGAYLRKGADRFACHQLKHLPRAYWGARKTDREGVTRVFFKGKAGRRGGIDLLFDCVYSPNPVPPSLEDIRALGKKPHPRLMIPSTEIFGRIRKAAETDEIIAATLDHLKKFADWTLTQKPYGFQLDGRRMWTQAVTARVFALAQGWKIFGDRRYLDRLELELRDAAAYPNWNESHFIDTGLMAVNFAVAYDWLYDDWSEEMRDILADALIRHALKKAEPDAFWIHNGNNWSQVCHAGMAMGSIAVAERCPELAQRLIGDAVTTFHETLEAYAPNGGYPEGVGYWNLATMYSILTIESFKSAFGTDFGLESEPGFKESGDLVELMTGPTGKMYGHSDSGETRHPHASLWWFAKTFSRGDLVSGFEREVTLKAMKETPVDRTVAGSGHYCEFCFMPLIWMVDVPKAEESKIPNAWFSGGSVPVAIQATDRSDPDCFWAGIKGGCANFSHAHADQSSFVFEALGTRWAEDIGGENYGLGEKKWGMEFWNNATLDAPRWKYFRLGPQGHNLVTVNAQNPDFMAYTPIKRFEDRGNGESTLVVDTSSLYPIAKGGATRTAEMHARPDRWVLTDEFKGVDKGTEFVWRMNTYAEVTIEGKTASLERDGKKLELVASEGEWSVFNPDFTDQTPAPGLRQLQLKVAAESENVSYSVEFRAAGGNAFFGAIEGAFAYVIALGASVMMPVIFTLLGLCIGIGFKNSIKSGLKVGVGFVGLGVITALLTSNLGPALRGMVEIYDLKLAFFDLGWPAAAAVAYSCAVGAFIIPVCLGVNIVMLLAGVTRTVNIDLWNYWHFAFLGAMVFFATGSLGWAFYAAIVLYVITLCMADFTAKGFQSYYKDMDGISIPQPFCQSFTPFAVAVGWLYDRIPGINRFDVDAEGLKQKFGLLGEPLFLGVIIGCTIGALRCESLSALADGIPGILSLGVIMGAVMELIPRITGLFIEGLKPISEATRSLIERKFNGAKGLSIGMSPALVIGHPTTLVVSILLIPVILFLSVVLPGNKFLPLASLAGMFYLFPCVLPVTKGNVVKTFVIGLVALVCGLYFVTDLTPAFSKAIEAAGCEGITVPEGFEGGAALDFASAIWCWSIYHLTVTLKWAGAVGAGLLALGMCAVNFERIRKAK